MTTQTTTNPAVAFIREGAQVGHWYLDGTMADVTAEQAHYAPPGRANPIGATFAHVVCSEDLIVNGMLRQQAPLLASSHANATGLSEPMPMPGSPDWGEAYGAWARRVQVDLSALKAYAEAVYAATDTYLTECVRRRPRARAGPQRGRLWHAQARLDAQPAGVEPYRNGDRGDQRTEGHPGREGVSLLA